MSAVPEAKRGVYERLGLDQDSWRATVARNTLSLVILLVCGTLRRASWSPTG